MSDEDRGLFVSTGGFTTDAKSEMRVRPLVELVDLKDLARLVIDHYDISPGKPGVAASGQDVLADII